MEKVAGEVNLMDKYTYLASFQKVIQSENIVKEAEKMDNGKLLLGFVLSRGMPQASPPFVTNEVTCTLQQIPPALYK